MSIESIILPTATRFTASFVEVATAHPIGFVAVGAVAAASVGFQVGKVATPAIMASGRFVGRVGKRLGLRVKAAAKSLRADLPNASEEPAPIAAAA